MGYSNKAEIGLTILLIVIVALLFVGWLININQRECKSNKDCNSESYCGSDFNCHPYPNIQKTIVQYNLVLPSMIIGIAMVISAFILKWKMPKSYVQQEKNTEEAKLQH